MHWRRRLRGRIFLLLLTLLAVCARSEKANFDCPEQFGYYPDSNDCSRYFVCVFGGALHESCTGGLFFSVDLQTCDWPRNVKCNAGLRSNQTENSDGSGVVSTTPPTTTTFKTAVVAKPLVAHLAAPTEVPLARKVASNAASQSVVHEHGASSPSSSRTPAAGSRGSHVPAVVIIGSKELSESQRAAAEEALLAEGFTEVYDVPRTVAKVKTGKCIGCHSSSGSSGHSTSRPRLQLDDDPGSPPLLAVDASSQSTERHRSVGHHHANALSSGGGSNNNNNNKASDDTDDSSSRTQQPAPQTSTASTTSVAAQGAEDTGTDLMLDGGSEDESQTPGQSPQYEYYDPDTFEVIPEIEDSVGFVGATVATTTTKVPSTSPKPTVAPLPPPPPAPRRPHIKLHAPDTLAKRCDPSVCKLPQCFCGGNQLVPGGLHLDEIPQMVLITFDDAVNDINWPLYEQLFYKGRKNPNGCSIAGTFYVSHEWTDYGKVQTLYSDGHEIASHSITHSYGEDFTKTKWEDEIYGQKEILSTYAGIKYDDIRGMRSPFLQIGGNRQYSMLYENNFTYDSSMPVYENKPPFWPYTLDASIPHECMIPPCPTLSFPGVWEIPLVMWVDLNGGRCSMADACSNPPTAEGVYKMLVKNFERHYLTNRAPFGLFYHSAWFAIPHHREGFEAFLDALVTMDDVYLVTSSQLISWMRAPTPLAKIKDFGAWQCHDRDRVAPCKKPKVCNLWFKGGVRYMKTCQPCPSVYPWITNTGSKNKTAAADATSAG